MKKKCERSSSVITNIAWGNGIFVTVKGKIIMKKRIGLFISLFLIMSTILLAQENRSRGWAALGYQMDLKNVGENADWNVGHGLKVLARCSMLPLSENIGLGLLFSCRFSFLKETDWISPDTGIVNKITDADFILDFGAMLGVSLHGQIAGPLGFGIGAGISPNWVIAQVDTFYTLLYGEVDLEFDVFDLGFGINAGIKFDISEYILEVGTDLSYSFFKRDSYNYHPKNDSLNIIKSNGVSGSASILRITPYVLFGLRF